MSILDFHYSCTEEFNLLLENFNLLFYGYGNKIPVLQKIFPKHVIIENPKARNLVNAINQELKRISNDKTHFLNESGITTLNSFIINKCVLILPNFNFKLEIGCSELKEFDEDSCKVENNDIQNCTIKSGHTKHVNIKNTTISTKTIDLKPNNLRIVATIDTLDFSFDMLDIKKYNFIFRDLTTFIPYNYTFESKNIDQLIKSVSAKSKNLFLFLLQEIENRNNLKDGLNKAALRGICGPKNRINVNEFIQSIKRKFLISKLKTLRLILGEFMEHQILSLKNDFLSVKISTNERRRILDEFGFELKK